MPEPRALSDTEAAFLAGVAPFNRDCGHFRGQRPIRGGRSQVRKALSMAGLVASRCHPSSNSFTNASSLPENLKNSP